MKTSYRTTFLRDTSNDDGDFCPDEVAWGELTVNHQSSSPTREEVAYAMKEYEYRAEIFADSSHPKDWFFFLPYDGGCEQCFLRWDITSL